MEVFRSECHVLLSLGNKMREYFFIFKNLFCKHYLAVIFSILVGLVSISPQLFLISSLGEDYKGIYILKTDAEEHYLARMQGFVKGSGLNNPFLYEGRKGTPSASFTTSESLLALPAIFFGISIPTLNFFYKFLLPSIIFLMLYGLNMRLFGDKFWSIVSSLSIVLGYTLFTVDGLRDLLKLDFAGFPASMYSRPVNPELSSVLFLGYLHLFLSIWKNSNKRQFIYLTLLFGLSFYIYFYSFTFFFTLNVVTFFLFFLLKRKEDVYGVSFATILGIIIGTLTILNLLFITRHPDYVFLAPISNIVSSHDPVFSSLGILALVVFLIYLYKRKSSLDYCDYFLFSLLITAFVVINQQVITGIAIQEGHYHWYFNIPIYLSSLLYVFHKCTENKKWQKYFIGVVLVILSFAVSLFGQYNYYKYWSPLVSSEQHYKKALDWLNTNSKVNDVVLANNEISLLIPGYTKLYTSWNYFALAYLTSRDRTIYNLFVYLKINNVSPDEIFGEGYFHPPVVNNPTTKNSIGYQFVEVNILLRDYMTGIYPDNMLSMYRDFYKKSWPEVFSQYRLNYIVWDKRVDPEWNFGQNSLDKVFDESDIAIYRLE